MRALWVEDHQLIGDSLEVLMQVLMPQISLDKARSMDVAMQLAGSIPYELLLVDWWLANQDGEQTIRAPRRAGCACPVIVVTADESEAVARRAQELGVAAFVSKAADAVVLVKSIRQALKLTGDGERDGVTPAVANRAGLDGEPPPALAIQQVFPDLTPRQADVFRGLMRGWSDKYIARQLSISETTVKTHVRAILQIVGAAKRGEAVYRARLGGAGEL